LISFKLFLIKKYKKPINIQIILDSIFHDKLLNNEIEFEENLKIEKKYY